jgi:hypothetical protein
VGEIHLRKDPKVYKIAQDAASAFHLISEELNYFFVPAVPNKERKEVCYAKKTIHPNALNI